MKTYGNTLAWTSSALFLLLPACTSVIHPPRNPMNPVQVFFIQDALHSGLALPDGDGRLVEYGYGDWDWYATSHDSWYHVFDTMLWPTQGTLGWRQEEAQGVSGLRERYPGMRVQGLWVESERCQALHAELQAQCQAASQGQVFNAQYGMSFVRDERNFSILHSCHDATASWMQALGCRVSWVPVRYKLFLSAQSMVQEKEVLD